jgi:ElaB/YqjD/DUF883 family membrane-anchored ribosome-binding protein
MPTLHTTLADPLAHNTTPRPHEVADQAEALLQRGIDAVLEGSHSLQQRTQYAQTAGLDYIRREPVKSVLLALALGAGAMALVALLSRRR